MQAINVLLNHMLTYCNTVDSGTIVLKYNSHVRIKHLFDDVDRFFDVQFYLRNKKSCVNE